MNSEAIQNELHGCRVLIAGSDGQLGFALQQGKPKDVDLRALPSNRLDITDAKAVNATVEQFKPHWVINAAAYTAVDKAESEYDSAFSVNRDGAANLAYAAKSAGARMVQVSTDYVFDGKQARPYEPHDPVNPINVYGESKLAGEIVTREVVGEDLLIVRTAWVYALRGKNFLTTMLRLMNERNELSVVEDQVGAPTSAFTLAQAIWQAIKITGVHHWTDAGAASWYDFACAIYEYASERKLVKNQCILRPLSSGAYPTAANRPPCSLLNKQSFRGSLGYDGEQWRRVLKQMI